MDDVFDMNHCGGRERITTDSAIKDVLQLSLERENEMMRTYLIAAERVHDDEVLKNRLRNFAEGNAKRSRQLMDELNRLQ